MYNSPKKTKVSIPNGMEFYVIDTFDPDEKVSFNSQRDGILRRAQKGGDGSKAAFQFPTGWNSTKTFAHHLVTVLFQFPTGWNSTKTLQRGSALSFGFQFPTGWNSTLIGDLRRATEKLFQFPTGWNSTSMSGAILLPQAMFQFPTGWNSTFCLELLCHSILVSIPNGMEFYERAAKISAAIRSFNSQRDGILLRLGA